MPNSFSSSQITESPIRNSKTTGKSSISTTRRRIAAIAFIAGLLIFAWGCYLETRNPRSNAEDDFAWLILGIGVSLGSFGISLRFLHPLFAPIIAVVAPPIAFCVAVVIFWVCVLATGFLYQGHQQFAANGVSQIAPASQMDELFDDCRHFITYGPNDVPLFNSVAYFGDRYKLTMQVPVNIESEFLGSITGEPKFYLNEISKISISPSGQVGASFSRNLDFGSAEWKQVYNANGDFGKIGFVLDPTAVPNFKKYTDVTRPSN